MLNILEVDSVMKRYSERVILSDIYLTCKTGDIIGLFGRNGVGKSTLLKIIFGLEPADNKFVSVNGNMVAGQSQTSKQISYLSQDSFLPKSITVLDIIKLTLNQTNVSDFSNDFILKELLNSKVSSLSGGELRYLEIKLLLNLPSKFVLLDEPYNGLSPLLIESVNDLIKSSAESKGIILTDHDYHSVLDVVNRFWILNDGNLKEIYGEDNLAKSAYLNPPM